MAKSKWLGASAKNDGYGGELSFRDSIKALKHLPPFMKLIWQTSPSMALWNIMLRLLQAGIPVTSLYIGKLIIDEVVAGVKTWKKCAKEAEVDAKQAAAIGKVPLADLLQALNGCIGASMDAIDPAPRCEGVCSTCTSPCSNG